MAGCTNIITALTKLVHCAALNIALCVYFSCYFRLLTHDNNFTLLIKIIDTALYASSFIKEIIDINVLLDSIELQGRN